MGDTLFQVTREDEDIIVRFDGRRIDTTVLSRLLDLVEMDALRKESQLTDDEVADLAGEVDRAVWQRIKHRYE